MQGLDSTNEQQYGLITSLFIHSIIFVIFFILSLQKGSPDIKTYYIEFARMAEQTTQAPQHVKEIKRPKPVEPERREIKEETPVTKDTPVKEHETVIRNDAPESIETVSVASTPEPVIQPIPQQGGESTGNSVAYAASSGTSSVVETAFGNRGAPSFLKRQMPVYPMMAKKLGKEGRVVLRLFINEKGKLMNVEVVESAGYGFTESAVEAVKMSTFSPAHHNGASIASKALLTIRFVLKKDG